MPKPGVPPGFLKNQCFTRLQNTELVVFYYIIIRGQTASLSMQKQKL